MTEIDYQMQTAEWEGLVDRRSPAVTKPRYDSFNPDPLVIAGDEGMLDMKELKVQQEVNILTIT